ncbi:MAG TPA: helix-turn-helix domain-containing protein [Candidatus Ozemobacteraceae bacterium]|nr:helix-turn-helix domain-containing protein [Candidatus Ozemobacteraceae bacterium]
MSEFFATFLTPAEVAKVLRSSVFHVRNLIKYGLLPAVRAGKRQLRVSVKALGDYLEAQRVESNRR